MRAGGTARRSQRQRRQDSEEALLEAASQVIAERGLDRASLATIGSRAGASRGLANHHFGTKEALLERVAERAQELSTASVNAAIERVKGPGDDVSALERLRTVVHTYLGRLIDPSPEARALIVMWGATFASETGVANMASADQRAYEGLAAEIRRGQEEGCIRADIDPEGTAVVVLGFIRGVGALFLTRPSDTDFTKVRRICDTWLMSALAPPVDTGRPNGPGNGSRPTTKRSTTKRGEPR